MSTTQEPVTNAQLMHELGRISGQVAASHEANVQRLQDLRDEIKRMDRAHGERVNRLEEAVNRRIDGLDAKLAKSIDGLGGRVTALENEDKRMIEKTAKFSALGGGIGGSLVAAAVELMKYFGK